METPETEPDRPRWLRHLPALLLVGVWVLQVGLTQTHGLIPWKGGGFGMFSVVGHRTLDVTVTDATGRTLRFDHLSLRAQQERLYDRARAMPSTGILCHVAEVIEARPTHVVSLEESELMEANRHRWRLFQQDPARAAALSSVRLDEPVVRLGAIGGTEGAEPASFVPVSVNVTVRGTSFDPAQGSLSQAPVAPSVTWQMGRCEVAP